MGSTSGAYKSGLSVFRIGIDMKKMPSPNGLFHWVRLESDGSVSGWLDSLWLSDLFGGGGFFGLATEQVQGAAA